MTETDNFEQEWRDHIETLENGETTREEADKHNRAMSAQEVEDFKSTAPSPYFAYGFTEPSGFDPVRRLHYGDKIGTWMGDELAKVREAFDPFRDNFGGIRQNFRALSIDRETVYSGTAYLSAGDYVRMRKVKP
jgi:hypothetical protein